MSPLFPAARWALPLTAILVAALVLSASVRAQPAGLQPALAQPVEVDVGRDRLMHRFDFEEAAAGNFESMPRYWYIMGRTDQTSDPNFNHKPLHRQMIQREGFPRFGRVQFNIPQTEQGDHNLHLGLSSGSVGAFLEVGAIAAVPQSDYAVTARIKTSELRHARARLIAYFVDAQGRRIDASASATPLLTTEGKWQIVTVKLQGDFPQAAWIGMQVELLQVQHQTPLAEGDIVPAVRSARHAVQYQDNKGDAWFDDISIWQVPRIVVRTQSPVNMIVAPHKPLLIFEVRDLSGRKLNAQVNIHDHHGKQVAQMARTVGGGEPATWQWTPTLPALGWYLVDMILHDPQVATAPTDAAVPAAPTSTHQTREPVARTIRTLLWLPGYPKIGPGDKRVFSLDVHDAGLEELRLLPRMAQATGLSSVIISAWDRDVSLATHDTRMAELDAILQPLWRQGTLVSMSFSPLPRELAERLDLDPRNPAWMFAKPAADWAPWVNPLVIRHGQNVRRWHLGPDVGGEFGSPALVPVIAQAVESINDLTPDPLVVVPWELSTPRRPTLEHRETAFAMEVSPTIAPAQFRAYLSDWHQSPAANLTLTLPVHPATEMSQRRRVDDLALRVLHAWEANVQGVTIPRPWDHRHNRLNALHPDPVLSVFATLAQQLHTRRAIGRLALGKHGQSMIFTGERGPMLAAWLDGGPNDKATVSLFLGDNPVISDVWGNQTKLELAAGKHTFTLTSTPIFIEGIDADLALLRASFAMTPRLIESSQVTHQHTLTLRNPFPQQLQGELTILEPGRDWKIDPRRIPLAIEPGATMQIPLTLSFPVAEVAGEKRLLARLDFASGKRQSIELTTTMEVGLQGIEMETGLSFKADNAGRIDATATAFVTNTGNDPRTLYVFAIFPGQPRQERIMTLKPGQSLMRKFRFNGIDAQTMNQPVRVGLRDTQGPALMNHVLRIDEP